MSQPDGHTPERIPTFGATWPTVDGHLDMVCKAAKDTGKLDAMDRSCPACLGALLVLEQAGVHQTRRSGNGHG